MTPVRLRLVLVVVVIVATIAAGALAAAQTRAVIKDTPFLQRTSARYLYANTTSTQGSWPNVNVVGPVTHAAADTTDDNGVWMLSPTTLYHYAVGGSHVTNAGSAYGIQVEEHSRVGAFGDTLAVATPSGLYRCTGVSASTPRGSGARASVASRGGRGRRVRVTHDDAGSIPQEANGAPETPCTLHKYATGEIKAVVVTPSGDVWYGGRSGLLYLAAVSSTVEPIEMVPVNVSSLAWNPTTGVLAVGTHFKLWRYDGVDWVYTWTHGVIDTTPKALAYDPHGRLWVGSMAALDMLDTTGVYTRWGANDGLPWGNITSAGIYTSSLNASANYLWMGTNRGAVVKGPDMWHFYYGPRWHPGTEIFSTVVTGSGVVVLTTDAGVAEITSTAMTLKQKAAEIQAIVAPRHLRYNLTASCGLAKPGDLSTWYQMSNDNEGLWTGMYAVSQAMWYKATGSPTAKANAWAAFTGLELLNKVTGIKGLMARSVWPVDGDPGAGAWHNSTAPGYEQFQWKGDTSSDEVDGHLSAYPFIYELVAETAAEKARVAAVMGDIVSYIVDNDYVLIDVTGNRTTWGVWRPHYLNNKHSWRDERGLNSLQMLTFLINGYRVTGNQTFLDAFDHLVTKHGYATNVINTKITWPKEDNFSDDELAFFPFLAYWFSGSTLMESEVMLGLNRLWSQVKAERASLWGIIYTLYQEEPDQAILDDVAWCLRNWAIDGFVNWFVDNSFRQDIFINRDRARGGGGQQSTTVIPYDEGSMYRWNSDPYEIDPNGNALSEVDPTVWLLPYYLAVANGLIVDA